MIIFNFYFLRDIKFKLKPKKLLKIAPYPPRQEKEDLRFCVSKNFVIDLYAIAEDFCF